jgi:hypothetical protein
LSERFLGETSIQGKNVTEPTRIFVRPRSCFPAFFVEEPAHKSVRIRCFLSQRSTILSTLPDLSSAAKEANQRKSKSFFISKDFGTEVALLIDFNDQKNSNIKKFLFRPSTAGGNKEQVFSAGSRFDLDRHPGAGGKR